MSKKGFDFLFSKDHGISDDDGGYVSINDDGSGYYSGADGSYASFNSDGSGYYTGADGSYGSLNSDGSGYFTDADGGYGSRNSDGSGYYSGADGGYGSVDSDGKGYYNSADGDYTNTATDAEDDEDSSTSGAEALGALLGLGLGLAAARRARQKAEEEERRQEYARQQAAREAEDRLKRIKRHQWFQKHGKTLFKIVVFVAVALILGVFSYELTIRKPVGVTASELVGLPVDEVKQSLMNEGFTVIFTNNISDLTGDSLNQDEIVTEIAIAGNTTFEKTNQYPTNIPIIITYHSLSYVSPPIDNKTAKGMDYQEVVRLYEKAGFIDISTSIKYDIITGWLTSDGSVESVTISGDKAYEITSNYRIDEQIVITYHTYRKNRPD